jgi:hypothetical protein
MASTAQFVLPFELGCYLRKGWFSLQHRLAVSGHRRQSYTHRLVRLRLSNLLEGKRRVLTTENTLLFAALLRPS